MKRCIDCKFSRYGLYGWACDRLHTSATVPDHIKGGTKVVDTTPYGARRECEEERASILPWKCGSKARYFQRAAKQGELLV